MPTPSWDLAITVIFLIGIAFGYILQKDKIVATLLGVYAGLIMTQALAGNIFQFFQGDSTLFDQIWIKGNANPFTIRTIIFLAVITLVSAKAGSSSGRGKGNLSTLEIVVYSVLTTALVLSSLFYFMPPDARTNLILTSRMAKIVIENYTWWLISPLIFMAISGFFHKERSSE